MRRNECVSFDVNKLAFEHLDDDGFLIVIPMKHEVGYVQCENKVNGRAFINERQDGRWCCYQLDEETANQIYNKLEVDT